MRTTWCFAVAVLVAGCDDDRDYDDCGNGQLDILEECDDATPSCRDCRLVPEDVTAHWSFETLSGDAKSPCLPGEPNVKVTISTIISGAMSSTGPCASGALTLPVKIRGLVSVHVESVADHRYESPLITAAEFSSPGQLETVVLYTDAGRAKVTWSITDSNQGCVGAGISAVRVLVDDAVVKEVPCQASDGTKSTMLDPILEGTHTLRVEGLSSGNVVAMTAPVDFTVVASTEVSATVTLQKN